MTPELARALERQRQIRQTRAETVRATNGAQVRARALHAGTTQAGDRVFDLETGQEGTVIGRTVENIIVPTAQR